MFYLVRLVVLHPTLKLSQVGKTNTTTTTSTTTCSDAPEVLSLSLNPNNKDDNNNNNNCNNSTAGCRRDTTYKHFLMRASSLKKGSQVRRNAFLTILLSFFRTTSCFSCFNSVLTTMKTKALYVFMNKQHLSVSALARR